ncbi:MAG: MFS transporter [Verrucomicrobia bacterium]|nr:MAG: MFS transporter [Verrucomicrobiota bacterium]
MEEQKQAFRKANVTSVAAAHTLHDVYSSFFAPLLPLLTEKLGFTYAMAGILSMVQKLPSLLNPLIGIIADRLVIRSAIVAAPILTIIAMSLLGLAPSVAVLAVLMFTCGISGAAFHVTAPVLMRRVSGNQIGRGMSYFMFGGEIARTLGPLLITAAVSWWGLEGTWRLIPFGLVASLLLFFNLRSIDKSHLKRFQKKRKTHLSQSIREIAPFFILVAPILLFRGFSKTALTLFLPTYMVADGASIKTAAFALAFLELAGAIGALAAGSLSDKLGRKTVLLVIMVLTPLLMFFFTLTTGWLQWILLGAMGLIFFASTPVFMAMIHDLNSDRPAFANGIFMTVSFAVGSIVALLVGVLADRYGFVRTYQITAALSLCAIPFTFFIKDQSQKRDSQ